MITETNQVKLSEIPEEMPIDQIYVLRQKVHEPLDKATVWDFFNDVKQALDRASAEQPIKLPGKLLLS
jgi:hypothetical protein